MISPSIWSGIYQRDFLVKNGIDFLETPGASYQDTGFILKVFICAEKVRLVKDAFLHYRTDNENSSVRSKGKVFCICDEFESVHKFLERYPEKKAKLETVIRVRQLDAYMWNYCRLADEFRLPFLQRMKEDFASSNISAIVKSSLSSPNGKKMLNQVMTDPEKFYSKNRESLSTNLDKESSDKLIGKVKGCIRCYQEHGFYYTLHRILTNMK